MDARWRPVRIAHTVSLACRARTTASTSAVQAVTRAGCHGLGFRSGKRLIIRMLLRLYRQLLPFAKPYRGKMILSSIFNILSNAIGSVNLLALLPIVSVILGESSMTPSGHASTPSIIERFSNLFLIRNAQGTLDQLGSLERICAFIFVTYALKNIFEYMSGYLMALVESGMARSLRDEVFEKLSKLSLDYYYDRKSGHLLSRLTNDVSLVNSTLASSIKI